MRIQANEIIYADHKVVCDPAVYNAEYMEEMSLALSLEGTAKDHEKELEHMNNDGSWTVS